MSDVPMKPEHGLRCAADGDVLLAALATWVLETGQLDGTEGRISAHVNVRWSHLPARASPAAARASDSSVTAGLSAGRPILTRQWSFDAVFFSWASPR